VELKNVLSSLLDLFFPRICLECGKDGSFACESCLKNLKMLEVQECPCCRAKSSSGKFCNDKCAKDFYFNQLVVSMKYYENNFAKKLIIRWKYKFSEEITNILGNILRENFLKLSEQNRGLKNAVVVPVPIHKKRLKMRGFNQAEELAKFLSPNYLNCLERREFRVKQSTLKRAYRLKNLRGAISLKNGFEKIIDGKSIILVDDVSTTGSTLNECSKVLKENGASYIAAIVLARG
jgi:competence protein ComFC